jgi:hypothetical protein
VFALENISASVKLTTVPSELTDGVLRDFEVRLQKPAALLAKQVLGRSTQLLLALHSVKYFRSPLLDNFGLKIIFIEIRPENQLMETSPPFLRLRPESRVSTDLICASTVRLSQVRCGFFASEKGNLVMLYLVEETPAMASTLTVLSASIDADAFKRLDLP